MYVIIKVDQSFLPTVYQAYCTSIKFSKSSFFNVKRFSAKLDNSVFGMWLIVVGQAWSFNMLHPSGGIV